MKKFVFGLLVCVLLLSTAVAASHPKQARIGDVTFDGWWHDGAVFHVNVYSLDDDADNAHIIVWIPELDVYDISRSFTMQDDGPDGKLVFVHFSQRPDAGWYLVRFSLTSDDVRDHKWRWVWLG